MRPDQTDQTLEIRVLGEFAVRRDGKDISLPPSRKTRALLAYLAVVDRPHRRERLCRMFWDVPDDPRGALRWSLSKIRQVVNSGGRDALVADRMSVTCAVARSQSICGASRRSRTWHRWTWLSLRVSRALEGGFLEDLLLPNVRSSAWRISHVHEVDLLKARVLRT